MDIGIVFPTGFEGELRGIPLHELYPRLQQIAKDVERLGYSTVWVTDHLMAAQTDEPVLECLKLISALATVTKTIRLGPLVCNGFRHPAYVAHMASTVDVMSEGRFILGINAGWFESEFVRYGYTFPNRAVRLEQLEEGLRVILSLWSEKTSYFEGKYYTLQGAIKNPKGVQQPHIPLLVGGRDEEYSLHLVTKYADLYGVSGNPVTVKQKLTTLAQECASIGRDFGGIQRRILFVSHCLIRKDTEEALALLPDGLTSSEMGSALVGSPEMVRSRIEAYQELGINELAVFFDGIAQLDYQSLETLLEIIH